MSEPDTPTLRRSHDLMDRTLLTVWVVRALTGAAASLMFVLPRLLTADGLSKTAAGWAMASFQIALLLVMVLGGEMLHKRGGRYTLLLGSLSALTGCLVYLAGSWHVAFYFGARALHGAGAGLITLTLQGAVMMRAHHHARGQAIGLANVPDLLTMALAPMIAESLTAVGWSRGLFVLAAGIYLAAQIIAFLIRFTAEQPQTTSLIHAPFGWNRQECTGMCFSFVAGFILQFGTFMVPLITAAKQGTSWGFSLFFLGYGLMAVTARMLIEPRLHGRHTPVVLMSASLLLSAMLAAMALTMAFALAQHAWMFALLGAGYGLGHGLYYPSLVQVMTTHIPRHRLMVRVGRLQSVSTFGVLLASPAAGALATYAGFVWALIIGAGGTFVGLAVTLFLIHRFLRSAKAEPTDAEPIATDELLVH